MTLLIYWIVFPAVVCALCVGCGALLERVIGFRLPGTLLVPAGLATLIVIATTFTVAEVTAELTTPAVVVAAIAGLVWARPWRGRSLDYWAAGAALAVFAVYAAPVVASGDATFAGYIKLDDSATWFALTDRVMEHGATASGLAPSSYEATVDSYLVESGYPVGSLLPLGVGRALVGQDLAWILQPYLAFLAATLALGLYSLATPLVRSRAMRASCAFVAAQPTLLFGYGLWGGVKELAAVALIPLVVILAARAASGELSPRKLIALAVTCAAVLSVLSVGAFVWLGPVIGGALLVLVWKRQWRLAIQGSAAFVALALVVSIPTLLNGSLGVPTEVLTSQAELGNLAGPLDKLQVIGIWPTGDFRFRPAHFDATRVLLAIAALSALGGLVWAVRRRFTAPLLYVVAAAAGCVAINVKGSPWADGKALATASPALLLFAMLGAAALVGMGRRAAGALLALAIASGVIWSNVLAYQEVNLAPRDRLVELEQIGEDFAGQGPSLMTEYDPYGVRHFLRKLDPEGASELRRRQVFLRDGNTLPKGGGADIDRFGLDAVLVYRTLVLRNTPLTSRPPLPYKLVRQGRSYDVWQRPAIGGPKVIEHRSLGTDLDPGGVAGCGEVEALARKVPRGGYLAGAAATPVTVLAVSRMARPNSWRANPAQPGAVLPAGSGTATGVVAVPAKGDYGFWIGGGLRGELTVSADGRHVATIHGQLNNIEQLLPLGDLHMSRGKSAVALDYRTGGARPGSSGAPFSLGPLVLAPQKQDHSVVQVRADKARELCGKRLDWIEAISP